MLSFLERLSDTEGLTPHGFCLAWEPWVLWANMYGDGGTAIAYLAIPILILYFALRCHGVNLPRRIAWSFAAFITLCGVTHFVHILTLWWPIYRIEAILKFLTATVSLWTVGIMIPLIPKALRLVHPKELEKAHDVVVQQAIALRQANEEIAASNEALKQRTAELEASQARYRAAFKLAPMALHTLDENLCIEAISNQWLALMQYAREEVIGRPITDFHRPVGDKAPSASEVVQELLKNGGIAQVERAFIRKDGSIVDTVVSARVESLEDGRYRVHASVADVTARKTAEAKLLEAEQALGQARKMEAIGQLTGGVAHDFNNMLQVISGNLHLMRKQLETQNRERIAASEDMLQNLMSTENALGCLQLHNLGEHGCFSALYGAVSAERRKDGERLSTLLRKIESAKAASDNAAEIAKQLLTVARRQHLEPKPFDPVLTVRDMESLLRASASAAGNITFEWQVAPDVGLCMADPNLLKAAVINLVNNACDALAIQDGGTITLCIDRVALPKRPGPDQPKEGDYVRVSVKDNGPGMMPAVRERVFEPFFTTKEFGKGTNGTGGTGLGLSMTYGFARQSGGTVEIDTAPGKGCAVSILLPRIDHAPPQLAVQDGDVTPQGHGETILVVEDEPGVLESLVEGLEYLGYKIIPTMHAPQAMAALQTPGLKIDAVLTDNAMPGGMLGIDLIREIRQRWPHLPTMMMSGNMTGPVAELHAMGARYLRKPYTLHQAASMLARYAGSKHVQPCNPSANLNNCDVTGLPVAALLL